MRIVVAGATGAIGRVIVDEARARGHDVVAVSRRTGVDVLSGEGLDEALLGADAVIDATSVQTTSAKAACAFFVGVTRTLQGSEARVGVRHHVALSVVGIDGVESAYYAGKLAQEQAVAAGAVPWSLLRATQFHEFAQQVLHFAAIGRFSLVPTALVRPIAAREVAASLVQVAEAGPSGRVADLRGPRDERLAPMVRRMLAFDGAARTVLEVPLPGRYGRAFRSGVLRGRSTATEGSITFDDWLRSADHTATR